MKLTTLAMLLRVTVEFFTYEAAWAASGAMRAIFFGRMFLMVLPLAAIIVVVQAALEWPSSADDLVTQREADKQQQANDREFAEIRRELSDSRAVRETMLQLLHDLAVKAERTETKVDWLSAIISATCLLAGGHLMAALLSLRLRRVVHHAEDRREHHGDDRP